MTIVLILDDGIVGSFVASRPDNFRGFVSTSPIHQLAIATPDGPCEKRPTVDELVDTASDRALRDAALPIHCVSRHLTCVCRRPPGP